MPKTQAYQERRSAVASVNFTSASTKPKRTSSFRVIKDSLRKLHSPHPHQPRCRAREEELSRQLQAAKIENAKQQEQIQVLTLERDEAETELHAAKRVSRCLRKDYNECAEMLEGSREMLAGTRVTVQTLLRERERQNAELEASRQQIESLSMHAAALEAECQEKRKLEAEKRALEAKNQDLDDWISDIKAAAKEANTHYNNLRAKLRTSEAIIAHLQHAVDTATTDAAMNKKALLRANTDLKREVERLTAERDAEKKSSAPTVDCLKDTRKRALARWRALQVGGENSISSVTTRSGTMAEVSVSSVTTVADLSPAIPLDDVSTEESAESVSMYRDGTGKPVEVLVVLLCLLAALVVRFLR